MEAVKYISHINKLRKGEQAEDYTKCKHLLVTETKRIQEISNAFRKNKYECGFALPTSAITNILWFKLGSGFSKRDYPINTDASYKARRILSGEIASNIAKLFDETKKQYAEGIIDKDQVASRIVLMQDKISTPDELLPDNIEELLDFSPEYIAKYEEGIKHNKVQLQEKQDIIDNLEAIKTANEEEKAHLVSELVKTTKERDASEALAKKQYDAIEEQNKELELLRSAEKERIDKKNWWKNLAEFLLRLLVLGLVFVLAVCIVTSMIKHFAPQTNSSVNFVVDAAGILGFIYAVIKGAWVKTYGKKDKID